MKNALVIAIMLLSASVLARDELHEFLSLEDTTPVYVTRATNSTTPDASAAAATPVSIITAISACGGTGLGIPAVVIGCLFTEGEDFITRRNKILLCVFGSVYLAVAQVLPCICDIVSASGGHMPGC